MKQLYFFLLGLFPKDIIEQYRSYMRQQDIVRRQAREAKLKAESEKQMAVFMDSMGADFKQDILKQSWLGHESCNNNVPLPPRRATWKWYSLRGK